MSRKLVKECLTYYIDVTGNSSEKFIQDVVKNGSTREFDKLNDNTWLAVKIFKLFQQKDITLADCLEFRNLTTQLKSDKRGMNVLSIWKKIIGKYIDSTDISRYELFELSDKNSELLYTKTNKDVLFCEDFNDEQNFFNLFDFDINNRFLYNKLPRQLQKVIDYKLPLFINMNPFLEKNRNLSPLYEQMNLQGFSGNKLLNNYYGCLFRVIMFCKEYNLTEVRIGFFTPLDMFYEKPEYSDFYSLFKENFKFNTGICFNPKSVGSKLKADLIGYTIWDLKSDNTNRAVVLKECVQHTDDTIIEGSSRLLRGKKDSLYSWETANIMHNGISTVIPKYSSIQTPSGETTERFSNVLCYQANAKNLLRSLKRVGVYSVPVGECTEVTVESFYKSVASYCIRSILGKDIDAPIFLSNPDTEVEGYSSWLADAVIYFLFSSTNMTKSYREKDLVLSNRLFPLKIKDVQKFIKDENILNDMNVHGADNLMITQIIDSIYLKLSKESIDLYSFCKQKIIDSLIGKVREDFGYKDSLVAWDASFYQIRQIDHLFTTKEAEMYTYLLSKLEGKLSDGIYKFGFVSD